MGTPLNVELRGYELTLRLADAQKIEIDSVHATDRAAPSEERHKVVAHPGVGELDKAASYHERQSRRPHCRRCTADLCPGRESCPHAGWSRSAG